ncbi:MAG: dUTP diphosphatase, partial [Methylocella sp.]
MTFVRITRLGHGDGLPLPAYETTGAAGMDLRAAGEAVLKPGARCLM